MASQIGRVVWDGDDVTGAGGDVPVASGAQVGLVGLVGLNPADLAVGGGGVVGHGGVADSAEEGPQHQCRGHRERGADEDHVPGGAAVLAVGVEAHLPSIVGDQRPTHVGWTGTWCPVGVGDAVGACPYHGVTAVRATRSPAAEALRRRHHQVVVTGVVEESPVLAQVLSATVLGVEGHRVSVEVHVADGLPSFTIVGLPDASVRESRDRVRAAVQSSGFAWPTRRVTVNLAPTNLRKAGSGLDLPMAVAVLIATGVLPEESVRGLGFIGELGLDGSMRSVPGVLAALDPLPDVRPVVAPRISPRRCWCVPRRSG